MQNRKLVYLNLIIISAAVICFEIITTRLSSVVFVNNYAFIILSLAILGLGAGGIYSYYKIKQKGLPALTKIVARVIALIGVSFVFFILVLNGFKITNPFIYFFFIFLPFFFAGIVYAQLFKEYAEHSFKLYASDLTGAAIGAVLSIFIFELFDAANAVLFLALILIYSSSIYSLPSVSRKKIIVNSLFYSIPLIFLIIYGKSDLLGRAPIGNYPEKDYYHVYPDAELKSRIIESRWSIYGRSDLVEYSHQDIVKQLFIDGAAGTQMYRFNGDVKNPTALLYNLILSHSTSIPLLYLREHEKDNMLVIGPGGGKEVLTGLLDGVKSITGVEVNQDFIDLVKEYRNFNGGIYTDFPNVHIEVKEGRHYIKKTKQLFDLIVMALPSTEQLQSIDNFAMNENYLLTVEAIRDYFKILTPEGRMIFTVHNRWELIRLIVTTLKSFEANGISNREALNHIVLLADDFAPTIVIKKNEFSRGDIAYMSQVTRDIPKEFPPITYLPYHLPDAPRTVENKLLRSIYDNKISLQQYVKNDQYDISAVIDDSPYFYKVVRGVPAEYLWLLSGILFFSLLFVSIPYSRLSKAEAKPVLFRLIIFICIGLGFMMLEISLFQKLVLYLGSPTISLSILLASLLIGMGMGSYNGNKIYANNLKKRISVISLLIVAFGILTILFYPILLNEMLVFGQVLRSVTVFFLLLPFGFLLGIPFPSMIRLMKEEDKQKYIPWMYGINGIMSILGSVLAIIISMLTGFTAAFIIGLGMYIVVYLVTPKLAE